MKTATLIGQVFQFLKKTKGNMNLQVKRTLRGIIGIVRHGPGGRDDTIICVTRSGLSFQVYLLFYAINLGRPCRSGRLYKVFFL
jgi:hypothetical protein